MSDESPPVNAVDRSELEGVRLEMAQGFSRMEGKLDAYTQGHASVHSTEQAAFHAHMVEAAVRQMKVAELESLPPRVDALEDWRIEVRAFGTILRATLGTSLLGAAAAIVALAKSLGVI